MLSKKPGSLTPAQKGKRTRLENKRAARYKRMGGQGEPPPLRWGSLFDSDVKEADEGMIVVKSRGRLRRRGPAEEEKVALAQAALSPWQQGQANCSES